MNVTMAWDPTGLSGMLLEAGLRSLLLLSLVAGVALTLRRQSAASRHLAWFAGLAGILLLPLATLGLPRWHVPVPASGRAVSVVGSLVPSRGASAPAPTPGVGNAARRGEAIPSMVPDAAGGTIERRASNPASDESASRGDRTALGHVEQVAPSGIEPAAPVQSGVPTTLPLSTLLALMWAAGAGLLLARLTASHLATRGLEQDAVPYPEGRVTRETAAMATILGLDRPVRMLRGPEGAMPVSWGLVRATVLLPAGAEGWHPARLRAVLLHELAHVARHDCATQAVADAARALYWPNPLAWIAAWRLRVEREHACDDQVLEAGARASEYARELLSLAKGFQAGPALSTAAVAMARPSRLASRLHAVLAEGRRRSLSRSAAVAVAACAVILTGAASAATPAMAASEDGPAGPAPEVATSRQGVPAPGAAAPDAAPVEVSTPASVTSNRSAGPAPVAFLPQEMTCGMETAGWQSMSHRSEDGRQRLQWSKPGCEVDVRVEGEVRFSDDFMDVASLGRNALFRIEENEGRTERRLDITPGSGGDPSYEYRVDGRTEPFDAQARAWYQGMLLQVFRQGGFMAEERVAALLRSGGVDAVLQELDLIPSDHVSAIYVEELMRQADLSERQVVQLVNEAKDRVDSDHYLAGILTALAENHDLTSPVMDAFLSASRSLDSDHYRAQVLTTALDRGTLQTAQVETLLASASEIDSDHYLAQILDSVSERYALNPSMRDAYLRAVASIESDHYRTQVLSGLLDRGDLSSDEMAEVLRAAGGVESDHYVTEILRKVSTRDLSAPLQDAYLDVARGIESDHYKAEALSLLVQRDRVSEALLAGVVDATTSIGSDHYKAGLLVEIARQHTLTGQLRDAFMRAMDTVGSQHYRGQVAEALLAQGGAGG